MESRGQPGVMREGSGVVDSLSQGAAGLRWHIARLVISRLYFARAAPAVALMMFGHPGSSMLAGPGGAVCSLARWVWLRARALTACYSDCTSPANGVSRRLAFMQLAVPSTCTARSVPIVGSGEREGLLSALLGADPAVNVPFMLSLEGNIKGHLHRSIERVCGADLVAAIDSGLTDEGTWGCFE